MARIEKDPRFTEQQNDSRNNQERQPVDRTPSKAEGDEETVERALENQDEKRS